jgi:hypothetical protein
LPDLRSDKTVRDDGLSAAAPSRKYARPIGTPD